MLIASDASRHIAMIQAHMALHYADIRTLGEAPSQPHFLPFHLQYLTDLTVRSLKSFTRPPTQPLSPCTVWDIHGWSSYTSTTGYHKPQNG